MSVKLKVEQKKLIGADKRTLIPLIKRLTTIEARERLKMGGCAPARDYEWWADSKRGPVWRDLLSMLNLFPKERSVEDVMNEEKPNPSKKGSKKKMSPKKEQVRSERAKRASCSNTRRGNHVAYSNCTLCDILA